MIRYHLSALALKAFSCSKPTRNLYRRLGNRLGASRRTTGEMPTYYLDRAERNIAWCLKYGPPRADDLVLELGTGWVHWEAITLRLFFDFQAVLYDVWDNRQLSALKSFVRQLEGHFGRNGFLEGCDFDRARTVIQKIEGARTFDDLYKELGFRYVLDPSGLMESLPRGSFRLAISAGVMEHIEAATAQEFVSNMADLLSPGGLGIHSIAIMDHLAFYDPSACPKQYLAYSNAQWKFWCENGVQYINRIQRSAWLQMFANAGLSVVEERIAHADVSGLKVHRQYGDLSREDIECTNLVVIVRHS
jgi:Methyltransferase domain